MNSQERTMDIIMQEMNDAMLNIIEIFKKAGEQ